MLKESPGSKEKIMIEASERYGIDIQSLVAKNGKVYEGRLLDGTACVLKLTNGAIASIGEYRGEADFLNHLSAKGVRVAAPLLSRNGVYVESIPLPSEAVNYIAVVYERALGNQWEGELTPARIEAWGEAVGHMHSAAKTYNPANSAWKRVEWHESRFLDFAALLPKSADSLLYESEAFIARLKTIPTDSDSYGLIHGNLHHHNLLLQGDHKITLIDFEEAEYNWFLADIAEAVFNESFHFDVPNHREARAAFAEDFLCHFLRGYVRHNRIDPSMLIYFTDFLRLRDLFLLGFRTKFFYDEGRMDKYKQKMSGEWKVLDLDLERLTAFVSAELR